MGLQIKARHLWDGDSGWTGSVSVAVDGSRIRSVEREDAAAARAPGDVLEFGDATILPGLIDMHTHLGINHRTGEIMAQMQDPPVRHILAGVNSLRADLQAGVTTAKLNGDREFYDIQLRDAVRSGIVAAPQLAASGRGIKSSGCTGGVVATCIADDVEAVGRYVDENLAAGADWIKLFSSGRVFGPLAEVLRPSYGFAHLAVAASKAHAAGKRMSSHCFGGEAADACLTAGVDVLDHGWLLSERQLEAIAKQGVWLCPTVGVLTHPEGTLAHFADGPARDEARRRIDAVCEVIAKAVRSGVSLLVGTDAMHGGVADELKALQDLGGAPPALLKAATGNAARALDRPGEIGAIHTGALADVVVVRGNALADVACIADVLLVVQGGRIVRKN